jgi:hypothetical protein
MFSFGSCCRLLSTSILILCISMLPTAWAFARAKCGSANANPNRGLLANDQFRGQPMKAIYFFPGESRPKSEVENYTAHPLEETDKHWLSQPATRAGVIDRMVAAHANVIAASWWDNMPQWSPMEPGDHALFDIAEATVGKPILVLPAIESGSDQVNCPNCQYFEFHEDFPSSGGHLAPKLIERIRKIIRVELINKGLGKHLRNRWAQLYDRDGTPRYAIQIIHTYSNHVPSAVGGKSVDQVFADSLQTVADEIEGSDQIKIGFTLDVIPGPPGTYTPGPRNAGPFLECVPAVLGIQGFASEVFSGKIHWSKSGRPPIDNNKSDLYSIVDWKAQALHDWVVTGVPVIYDVSSGFDGRFIWKDKGTAFWGDNLEYTDDRWRNALSQFKGNGIKGITFNTWNGYTEGYAATKTLEHGLTIYNWLQDLYQPDPRDCSHMQYAEFPNHVHRAVFRVFGAICEHWRALGGDRGFLGAPTSVEMDGARGRKQSFKGGKMYWSDATDAHAVHDLILKAYLNVHAEGGCLGLPITDELPEGPNGRVQKFQNGVIHWKQGDSEGSHICGVH